MDKDIVITTNYTAKGEILSQQQKTVTGRVIDNTDSPLPGVSVVVKGTTTGTITDADGNYSLANIPANATLQFSFVGMKSQEIVVGNQATINVSLSDESIGLQEVIAVGYGTQTKRSMTGSIQSVSSKELKDIPVAQVGQALQGKLAGVQINQSTGVPGQAMQIRVRGAGSISAGSSPLYVVDGFPLSGDLSNFNSDEIETVTVLKDAASTSLYGSRAANGVVMITTKKAANGKTEVNFSSYYGVQKLPVQGRPDMMNGTEFAQFKKESYEDRGLAVPAAFQNPAQYGEGYNWYEIMFRNAPVQDYSLSVTSKTDKFSVAAVGGYMNQEGILLNSGYSRYSLRVNTDFKVNEKVSLGFNVAPTYSTSYTPSTDGIFWTGGLLSNALQTWPIVKYKNDDGTLPLSAWLPGLGGFPAPNYYRAAQEIKTTRNNFKLLSNAFLTYSPIKGLVLKSAINVEYGAGNSKFFNPSTSSTGFATVPPITAVAQYRNNFDLSWLLENTATYSKSFGDHNFEALAGYSTQKYNFKYTSIRASGFPDDRINDIDAATTLILDGTDSDDQEWSLISYISRLNYDYKGKYMVSAAIRRDGSSRFGSDNRWGNFPSVSVGWVASDESFFPKNNTINFVKLRGSYGLTGNNNIGNYTQYALVNLDATAIFGSTIASGSYVNNLSNPMLGWETTSQLDIGADINLLNNRITVAYDYYSKRTKDLLYNFVIPNSSGFTTFTGNSGELAFWGHEISVTSRNTVNKFKWTTNLNLTFGDNEVKSLATGINAIYAGGHVSKVGQRLGLFYGMVHDGVYKNQAEYDALPKAAASAVGTVKFKDVNGDGVIRNANEESGGDQTVIGDPTPDFLFGFTNNFNYKNFDLSIVMSGSVGNDLANRFESGTTNLDGPFNVLKEVKDRWRSPENPGAGKYGTTKIATSMERDWFNSRFVQDGSFLTVKNITLGYNMNVSKLKYFSRLRVYASVQQAYTFTKYKGNNPEVSTSQNGIDAVTVLTLGDDYASYPVARTFTVGLNLGF
jgi:TonB-linked SusC/RagA family outer membrane protein